MFYHDCRQAVEVIVRQSSTDPADFPDGRSGSTGQRDTMLDADNNVEPLDFYHLPCG
jgi:hypothetical protein